MTGVGAAETLLGRLFRHAELRPDARAYQGVGGGMLSYGMLAARISALAAELRKEFPPGAVIVLSCCNQLDYPVAFFGILAAGCTVFPVSSEAADVELLRAAAEAQAVAAIGDERTVALLRASLRTLPLSPVLRGEGRGEGSDAENSKLEARNPKEIRNSKFEIHSKFELRASSFRTPDPSPQPSPLSTGERGPEGELPVSSEAADVELLRAAKDAEAVAAIGEERTVELLHSSLRTLPLSPVLRGEGRGEGSNDEMRDPHDLSSDPSPQPSPLSTGERGRDDALLLQSSGTTGLPKIVRRSGASLDAVALAMAEGIGFLPTDRVLMAVPLTHSYGLEHGLLAPMWAGSCVHLCRGLDLSAILPELSGGGITLFPGVPSTFEMIASVAEIGVTMPTLRTAYSAGGPLPRSVYDAFLARFGIRIAQLYGASEIGSVTFNPPGEDFNPSSVGLPFDGVSIRILHPDTNGPLAAGDEGQVTIRAASMFSGYLTAPADLIDGYFPTGDLGHLDPAGRLFITGRIKLLIDVGGLKVNPLEVEAVLAEHPGVRACVVVPVKQSETVFRLKAIVTPRDPAAPPASLELRRFAKARLAAYKVPRLFEVRDSLPRSATGKVLRHLVESS